MIDVIDNKKCCGCNACVNICPKQCIHNQADSEGFLYPVVDRELCIGCNLCEKVCPEQVPAAVSIPLSTEGMIYTDANIRRQSSSGGVFSAIAANIISKGGIVYGARFTADWRVIHSSAETVDELQQFRGSKYVQSDTGTVYADIKRHLQEGRWVLFSGTPCQVRGLRLFLRCDYERLFCVDFICHGVPSDAVFQAYLDGEVMRLGFKDKNEIRKVNFRDKSDAGWHRYCLALTRDNSDKPLFVHDSAYMRGFGANLYLRPSCYSCPTKNFRSGADITLADYWRVETLNPELDDSEGTSLVTTLTKRGQEILAECAGLIRKEVNADKAYRMQISLRESMPIPETREVFWQSDWRNNFINVVNEICGRRTLRQRTVDTVKTLLRNLGLKRILAIFFDRFR